MKKLLPLLVCYVLTQSQCFALSGGPVYGGNGNVNTVGSYSGTLQGVTEIDPTSSGAPAIPGDTVPGGETSSTSSNALGLFDLIVPGNTTASGAFLLFADGVVFGGTIQASVDPDSAKLAGILNGTYDFNVTTDDGTTTTTTAVTATAVGMVNAKIAASGTRAATAARLNGTANLEVSFGQVNSDFSPVIGRIITFTVTGFQATAAAVASSATTGTGDGLTGGSTGSGGSGG